VASAKELIEYKSITKICGSWNKKIGTRLARRNELNLNTEQKYRDRVAKKGTRLARRNELNLNTEQKYRDRGGKRNKASTKEQIEFKRGTKI
jgi:hypothetical protein